MTKRRFSPAFWFLAAIVILILLVLAVFGWIGSDPQRALRIAFVPSGSPADERPAPALDYSSDAGWYQRPGITSAALLRPEGLTETAGAAENVDVFFVHPTTLLDRRYWTDPLNDEATLDRTSDFSLKHQASVFADAGRLFAPRYRQASFGAFLAEDGAGLPAIQLAYTDILAAFDAYMADMNAGRPFVLAGHSQGSLHLLRLLKDRIVERSLQDQLIAAYIIGWPVSIEADLGALDGITACEAPGDTSCVISWQSFGPGGDPTYVLAAFNATPGLSGAPHAGTTMLCSNPLSGAKGGSAAAELNIGALDIRAGKAAAGPLEAGFVGARCGDDGILYLDRTPSSGNWREYILAGENYHGYDYNLFWGNMRADALWRVQSWLESAGQ